MPEVPGIVDDPGFRPVTWSEDGIRLARSAEIDDHGRQRVIRGRDVVSLRG